MSTPEKRNQGTYIPKKFRKGLRGTARGVENKEFKDNVTGTDKFLAFRLEIVDNEGNIKELVPVEVLAKTISGRIRDGDTIVVIGKRNRRGLLKPKGIYNESTKLVIKMKNFTLFGTALGCLTGIFFLASIFGLVTGIALVLDGAEQESGILLTLASGVVMILSIYFGNKSRSM
jgi:hypothetical protein